MSEVVSPRAEETHKAITRHYAEMAARYADLKVDAPVWTTDKADGACEYVFGYLRVDCHLHFPSGLKLSFEGNGLVIGLGGTGALAGQASFNVDPETLKGMSGITFQATSAGVIGGGFQVTWFHNNKYIGHGEFIGLGVQLGTPGGGWGSFH
jgi:hypothetical protein